MDGALDLTVAARHSATALGVIFGIDLNDIARFILFATRAFDDIGVLQAHFAFWFEAEELLRCVFHEVVSFDVEFTAEGDVMLAVFRFLWVILRRERLCLSFWIVGQNQFDGVQHGTGTHGVGVQVLTNGVLQQGDVNQSVVLGVANGVNELVDALRRVATATQAANGRHARVVPSANNALLDELQHLALAHHGVGDVQSVELDLSRAIFWSGELVDEPVVERSVHFKLKGAEGVGHAFEVVALSVGEVIHGIDFPLGTRAVVRVAGDDAIDDGVTEVHVGRRHVNLGAKHHFALFNLAAVHGFKQAQVLLDRTITEG